MPATNITAQNSNAYSIPVTPGTNQEFDISLAGVTYHLKFKWNSFSNAWTMDLMDSTQKLILPSIPLVTGCDLLEQFDYLDVGGAFVVQSTNDPDVVPDFAGLGATGFLFFVVPSG
jgi:hypothetical protein